MGLLSCFLRDSGDSPRPRKQPEASDATATINVLGPISTGDILHLSPEKLHASRIASCILTLRGPDEVVSGPVLTLAAVNRLSSGGLDTTRSATRSTLATPGQHRFEVTCLNTAAMELFRVSGPEDFARLAAGHGTEQLHDQLEIASLVLQLGRPFGTRECTCFEGPGAGALASVAMTLQTCMWSEAAVPAVGGEVGGGPHILPPQCPAVLLQLSRHRRSTPSRRPSPPPALPLRMQQQLPPFASTSVRRDASDISIRFGISAAQQSPNSTEAPPPSENTCALPSSSQQQHEVRILVSLLPFIFGNFQWLHVRRSDYATAELSISTTK